MTANGHLPDNWTPRPPTDLDFVGEFAGTLPDAVASWLRAVRYPWPRISRANRKTVLFIPGFMAADFTLSPLGAFCTFLGHRAEFGGIMVNSRCPRDTIQQLEARLGHLAGETGERVAVVGHSLGGIYARLLANRHPELVERVVTLGSPMSYPRDACHRTVRAVADTMAYIRGRQEGCLTENCPCGLALFAELVSDVPVTAIYSRNDGIVHWESCIDRSGASSVEHEEVSGTHVGMAISFDVYRIVADRLAMPRDKPHHRNPRFYTTPEVWEAF